MLYKSESYPAQCAAEIAMNTFSCPPKHQICPSFASELCSLANARTLLQAKVHTRFILQFKLQLSKAVRYGLHLCLRFSDRLRSVFLISCSLVLGLYVMEKQCFSSQRGMRIIYPALHKELCNMNYDRERLKNTVWVLHQNQRHFFSEEAKSEKLPQKNYFVILAEILCIVQQFSTNLHE